MEEYVMKYLSDSSYGVDRFFGFVGGLLVFIIIFFIFAFILYIFNSIALMSFAKKNNVANAWLAWIPCGQDYILGKLGYEVYDKKYPVFVWILFGLSVVHHLISGDFAIAVRFAYMVFSVWAYYNIFKAIKPNSAIGLMIVAIFGYGGLALFCNRNTAPAAPTSEDSSKTEPNKTPSESSSINNNNNFCPNCGSALNNKDSKFCAHCGTKI